MTEPLSVIGSWAKMVLTPFTQEKSHLYCTHTHENHFMDRTKKYLSPTSTGVRIFSLSKTVSEHDRVAQCDRKLGQDRLMLIPNFCIICITNKK